MLIREEIFENNKEKINNQSESKESSTSGGVFSMSLKKKVNFVNLSNIIQDEDNNEEAENITQVPRVLIKYANSSSSKPTTTLQLQTKHQVNGDERNEDMTGTDKSFNTLLNINRSKDVIRKEEDRVKSQIYINLTTEREEKASKLRYLKEMVKIEMAKVKICELCKRKFVNKAHLTRHINCSKLHQKNFLEKFGGIQDYY